MDYKRLQWVTRGHRVYKKQRGIARDDRGLQGVPRFIIATGGYQRLQGITRNDMGYWPFRWGNKGLQLVAGDYKWLQGLNKRLRRITGHYKGLQLMTRD